MSERRTQDTRDRLLEAAAEVFAEHGYRNGRVRDICERARANIAAVNYYFGDKRKLYGQALHHAFFRLSGADPTEWGVPADAGLEELLRGFARTILGQLTAEGETALYPKLVARELADPTDSLERIIEAGIRPQLEVLHRMVQQALGEHVGGEQVRRSMASILGQCLFYYFARPVIERVELLEEPTSDRIDAIADHIAQFSLAGLRHIAKKRDRPR